MLVLLHSKSHIVSDIPGFERELDAEYSDADLTGEQAGRLCYLSWNRPNPKTATNQTYLFNIDNEHHYSVLSHGHVGIYVEGISRNCTHEIIRSRFFSISELSQRYADATEFEFVQHPGLTYPALNGERGKPAAEKLELAWHAMQDAYIDTANALRFEQNYTKKESRQAARGILPGGIETKILLSGNLRTWRDFLAQRLPDGADLEIGNVALLVYKIMKREFPNSFQDFDSKGMITFERMVQRAMNRYRKSDKDNYHLRSENKERFVQEVDRILEKGLWILDDDPWVEED